MPPQPKKTLVSFTVDRPSTGLLQMHFTKDICTRNRSRYPVCFHADPANSQYLDEPGFTDDESTIVRALVATLIKDGRTGVDIVVISSRKGIKVYYNPSIYLPSRLKADIRDVLRDVDRHGWIVKPGW